MALGITYPHIEKQTGQPARLQRVPRVRVAQIAMDYLAHGWSADEMCRQHPYLFSVEAHAAMTYYFDHQAEVDEEIRGELEQAGQERASRSPFWIRLHAHGLL
jgi:hypothetical protein